MLFVVRAIVVLVVLHTAAAIDSTEWDIHGTVDALKPLCETDSEACDPQDTACIERVTDINKVIDELITDVGDLWDTSKHAVADTEERFHAVRQAMMLLSDRMDELVKQHIESSSQALTRTRNYAVYERSM